jgi:uncharacterized protein (DUF3820 family)
MRYTDKDRMPFGKYVNIPLEQVPDAYLLWLYRENKGKTSISYNCRALLKYIEESFDEKKLKS